jgi:G3E family GTPase
MSSRTLLSCVGGFLGAGKTTSLQRAAAELRNRGMRVAVVVNDQGSALVDTHAMRASGAVTEEITGGCFCCKFDELVETLLDIRRCEHPDVILAEAVGSCTDLSATVYRPLQRYFFGTFDLAPLSIVVDPARISAMSSAMGTPFAASLHYLFTKQIAEADLVVLNKLDCIDAAEQARYCEWIEALVNDTPVHWMSAQTGTGVSEWVDMLLAPMRVAERTIELDYDTYAAAEAALAWLNATVSLDAERDFSPREFAESFLRGLQRDATMRDISIAHVKTLVHANDASDRLALTDNTRDPLWSGAASFAPSTSASLIINARVGSTPEQLSALIHDALAASAVQYGIQSHVKHTECFSPQRPTPRYRFSEARP